MKCRHCGGSLVPNFYKDEEINERMISGLTCINCLRNVITPEMTIKEYNKALEEGDI